MIHIPRSSVRNVHFYPLLETLGTPSVADSAPAKLVHGLILSKSGEPESALQADKTGMGTEPIQFRFHLKENETVGAIGIRFFEPIQRFVVPAQSHTYDGEVIRRHILGPRFGFELIQ